MHRKRGIDIGIYSRKGPKPEKENEKPPLHTLFFPTLAVTSFSICSVHRVANSSSVNLLADFLAR